MKRLLCGIAALTIGAGSATGALIIYTPTQPLYWGPGVAFDPSSPNGTVPFGAKLESGAAGTTPALTRHYVDSILLMSIKVELVPDVIALYHSGTRYTLPGGDFSFLTFRNYPVGGSVGVDDPSGTPTYAWSTSAFNFSRTYIQRDASAPGGERFRTLPTTITAGFTSFSFVTGYSHPCWADLRWVWGQGNDGSWTVTRWGYETSPNTPARVPPPSGCVGDTNDDGDTNAADLSVLLAQFGMSVPPMTGGDVNGDGVVNTADLSVLLSWFGCDEVIVST